ncbi:MAG: undecaprenyl/decaprenyl-phosphate alpha-N-acetylglucosaminyl 1-phosphate transferase [bacterium]|nr:undecaprenyl/decaprenyl-phosphate alpha-N-acetylglucosaminyl 1-phosphate transferase [bacterium]
MSISLIAIPLGVAMLVSAMCTPIVMQLARASGVVDRPNERKISLRDQMPLLGGLAVAAGVAAGLFAVVVLFDTGLLPPMRLRGFLFGSGLILAVGIIDDRFGMGAVTKLAGQIAAASIAFHGGFAIESIRVPMSGDSFEFSWWIAYAVTLLWIVAVTNAVNLIDGLDGLATGISAIMAITMAYVCLTAQQVPGVVYGAAIIGGALGFLPYNFPPARIFLGDTGALYLGFSISLLAIEGYMGGYRRASVLPFVVPLMALAVPLLDTALSIARRLRSGAGIFSADSMHMHHQLLRAEGSHTRAVVFLYLLTACFCSISVYFAILDDLLSAFALLGIVFFLTIRLLRNLGVFSDWSQAQDGATAAPESDRKVDSLETLPERKGELRS